MHITIKSNMLLQAIAMYIASAKRQKNSTNLLPQVKDAIAQDELVATGIHSAIAAAPGAARGDLDFHITDQAPPVAAQAPRNK